MRKKSGGKMFWGTLFICIGIIFLINNVFGINLPILKILFGLWLVYMGIKIIFGSSSIEFNKVQTSTQAIFSESQFRYQPEDSEFKTVFGSSKLDLTSLDLTQASKPIEIQTVFGETEILIKKDTPFTIESNAAFAGIRLPTKDINAFGEFHTQSANFDKDKPNLQIKINAVFASVVVKEM